MEVSQDIGVAIEPQTGARSALYGWLAGSFAFPTLGLWTSVSKGEFLAAICEIVDRPPYLLDAALMHQLDRDLSGIACDF